jgi:hypothetical protein
MERPWLQPVATGRKSHRSTKGAMRVTVAGAHACDRNIGRADQATSGNAAHLVADLAPAGR